MQTRPTLLEHPAQVNTETVPQGPTEHLLYKTALLRMRDISSLPNTQKNTGIQPKGDQKNMSQIKKKKKKGQNSSKKNYGDGRSTQYRVQNTCYEDAQLGEE